MHDNEALFSPFYALGARNQLMPTGEAIHAWGAYIKPVLLKTDGNEANVEAFAARSEDGGAMTVWLLNRGRALAKSG